jgi:hypothetical protein
MEVPHIGVVEVEEQQLGIQDLLPEHLLLVMVLVVEVLVVLILLLVLLVVLENLGSFTY